MWTERHDQSADAIVIGAGLAGLVAANELADAGKKVLLLDQEPEASLGGQAFWSLGGMFLVDSPEQRRMGIRDSHELALTDWMGTAGFDRAEDHWPRRWAEAYVAFAAGEKRSWLRERGIRFFPVVGWAERGGYNAIGHGNSVPRFHIAWGTGTGVVAPFAQRARGGGGARADCLQVPPPRDRNSSSTAARWSARAAKSWSRAPSSAARRARGRGSAISNSRRRR